MWNHCKNNTSEWRDSFFCSQLTIKDYRNSQTRKYEFSTSPGISRTRGIFFPGLLISGFKIWRISVDFPGCVRTADDIGDGSYLPRHCLSTGREHAAVVTVSSNDDDNDDVALSVNQPWVVKTLISEAAVVTRRLARWVWCVWRESVLTTDADATFPLRPVLLRWRWPLNAGLHRRNWFLENPYNQINQ